MENLIYVLFFLGEMKNAKYMSQSTGLIEKKKHLYRSTCETYMKTNSKIKFFLPIIQDKLYTLSVCRNSIYQHKFGRKAQLSWINNYRCQRIS